MNRLLDANVLVALVAPNHEHHASAHRWFAGVDSWATTPMTEAAFVRLVANPAVMGAEHAPAAALTLLARLRARAGHHFIADASALAQPAIDLAALVGFRQVTDFHLVNLAAQSGSVLATFDAKLVRALGESDRRHVEVVPV